MCDPEDRQHLPRAGRVPLTDPGCWHIWIDTGGTFTDAVGVRPDGSVARAKVLSTAALRGVALGRAGRAALEIREQWAVDPAVVGGLAFRWLGSAADRPVQVVRFEPRARWLHLSEPLAAEPPLPAAFEVVSGEAPPVFAARVLTGTPAGRPLPPCRMRLATTLGTNALLEGDVARVALFTTRGFGDLLAIGSQQRPDLFRLDVRKPQPLYAATVEVPERLAADGSVLEPLRTEALETRARDLLEHGIDIAAVALLHAYRNPSHEQALERWLRQTGFRHVSCSTALAPRIHLVRRAETAVVDACLAPLLQSFVERVEAPLHRTGRLLLMTSAGGLLAPGEFRPKDGLLSGPAAGVVGAVHAARRSGCARIIGLDMGGTSTDVARWDGELDYRYTHRVGPAVLAAPALAVETVAAGGGSICWLDGRRLQVGPSSAGARPGPACYGAGGPLALTDVNLLLGRLDARQFRIPIDPVPARARLAEIAARLEQETGERVAQEALAESFAAIANEAMADAMRRISVRRGYDPTAHALVAFGGAGGQHACAVADLLGMRRIVVPADAGLLSAQGLGHAVVERFAEQQVLLPLAAAAPGLGQMFAALSRTASGDVVRAGVDAREVVVRRRILHLRLTGQDATLDVDWDPADGVPERFAEHYAQRFGHLPEGRDIEVESVRVVVSSLPAAVQPEPARGKTHHAAAVGSMPTWLHGRWWSAATFMREALEPGAVLPGPALVFEPHGTTVVEPGWTAVVDGARALVLDCREDRGGAGAAEHPEAARLELFTRRFTSLVEDMGERLERTAVSTNVKERLDFSCALADPQGRLVANAPHIPVHLGAMGLCVRSVARALPLGPGDVAVTNHPGFGGSHLPDVTVITPVFATDSGGAFLGYVASRAHHAEIGGSRPGSMPPRATRLVEEGVIIPPTWLVRGGQPEWDAIRATLEGGEFPSRCVSDNLADLRAAVAANHAGAALLRGLAATHGAETVLQYMERLRELSAERMRQALAARGNGIHEAEERLDDGTPLRVRLVLEDGRAHVDFTGSGPVHSGNLNATPAIVHSVLVYVLRLLLDAPLPLNEGLLAPVSVLLPAGILDPRTFDDPACAPAVVGGNVETSQRLVDTLLRALDLAACSQGTMNNLIFGNARFGYYETIGGGAGAVEGCDGASGVHTHMTNTRITDPEVLERRYPVRVVRFALRRGSGGAGRFRGGDGLIRELEFLEPVALSILAQHRTVAPYGLHGGSPGSPGRQHVIRADGRIVALGPIDGAELGPGDRVVVETPGGGGCGATRSG